MANTELENKLKKGIFQLGLRELITKVGIPESQAVELKLYVAEKLEATVTVPSAMKLKLYDQPYGYGRRI